MRACLKLVRLIPKTHSALHMFKLATSFLAECTTAMLWWLCSCDAPEIGEQFLPMPSSAAPAFAPPPPNEVA